MTVSLLGLQISHGYSPEARVFAELLSCADPMVVKALVLLQQQELMQQQEPQKGEAVSEFHKASGALVQPVDFGWRSVAADRSLFEKLRARLQFFGSLPQAAALARQFKPDVIYSCQQLWDCQAATYIARKLKLPQIIHLHYTVGAWLHPPVLRRLLTCDHVIAISDFVREEALRHGVAPEKVTTVRNALPLPALLGPEVREAVRRELGIAEGAPLLGIAARLDPEKNQADVLKAFAVVREAHPAARLLIAGNPSPWHPAYTEALKEQAAALELGESVLFLGYRSDVPRLLAALDIFVHPARREPFGLAMAEASGAGLPVAGYAEGGACEIVEDGITGLLCKPGDVEALAASLLSLIENPHRARCMGAAGRSRIAKQFRPDESSRRLEAVVQAVAAASAAQRTQ